MELNIEPLSIAKKTRNSSRQTIRTLRRFEDSLSYAIENTETLFRELNRLDFKLDMLLVVSDDSGSESRRLPEVSTNNDDDDEEENDRNGDEEGEDVDKTNPITFSS
jgi:hypothetical protein